MRRRDKERERGRERERGEDEARERGINTVGERERNR